MKEWKKFSIQTNAASVELISGLLYEKGITAIETEGEPLSEAETDTWREELLPADMGDGVHVRVIFYLSMDEPEEELLKDLTEGLADLKSRTDIGAGTIEKTFTREEDWVNNWKQYFHAFSVGDLWIKPTWLPLPEGADRNRMIEIDPGTSFGTGAHETTKLIIEEELLYVKPGDEVLDVGCGSGILGIVAVKQGARHVTATDISEDAIRSTCENAAVNGLVDGQIAAYAGDLLKDEKLREKIGFDRYDLVVANILADVIEPLIGEADRHLKKGGLFLTSGIIETKAETIRNALKKSPSFEIVAENKLGEWVSFVARRI